MRTFTATTALLLCSLSLISVSGSQTVNVQLGEEVTLMCSISGSPTQKFWFKLDNTTKISCISSMSGLSGALEFCTDFQNGKFNMSSNISVVFLNIKQVDLSDSGLYLCGYYKKGHTIMDVRQLNVQGKGTDEPPSNHDDAQCEGLAEPDRVTMLTSVILAALAVLLIMVVVGLLIKVRKLQKAAVEKPNPEELNYAALSFQNKSRRTHRPAPERQLEPNVVYAATR